MVSLSTLVVIMCVIVSKASYSDAIMCYQCADSTDNPKLANCMHQRYNLVKQRSQYQFDGVHIPSLPYLKNCSHYIDEKTNLTKYELCKIETIQADGLITGYIRECSNGSNFARLNVTQLAYASADNQTTCGYASLQEATICVQLCDTDFCNGPNTGHTVMISSLATFILAFIELNVPVLLLNEHRFKISTL